MFDEAAIVLLAFVIAVSPAGYAWMISEMRCLHFASCMLAQDTFPIQFAAGQICQHEARHICSGAVYVGRGISVEPLKRQSLIILSIVFIPGRQVWFVFGL